MAIHTDENFYDFFFKLSFLKLPIFFVHTYVSHLARRLNATMNHSSTRAKFNMQITPSLWTLRFYRHSFYYSMHCIAIAVAITDSRYCSIADTVCSPQMFFLLFHLLFVILFKHIILFLFISIVPCILIKNLYSFIIFEVIFDMISPTVIF